MKPRRSHLHYLLLVYALGVACFTCFRWLLLSLHQKDIHYSGMLRHRKVFEAFVMGFRFDTVIACYLLALPFVVVGLLALSGLLRAWVLRLAYAYTSLTFITAFLLCAADIPFFAHFFRRLDDTVLAWKGHSDFGLRMVLQESSYYWFIFVFFAAVTLHTLLLRRIRRAHLKWFREHPPLLRFRPILRNAGIFVLTAGLFLLGMRGRVAAKTPILAGAAYICDDPTINSLGLNPVFTFMRTLMDAQQPDNQRLHWISDAAALKLTAASLGADAGLRGISPIARMQQPQGQLAGRNVVLVIMESLSSAKMRRYGNTDGLTPVLDSLADAAWSFDNIWSAGIHTYNGIYSTLTGHPALMKKHPMEQVQVPQIDGLPEILRRAGYQTLFFTTHDELFDNMSGFLSANGMERIIGQKDYPHREVKSAMGVPDEYMFRFAIPVLNKAATGSRRPFFAAFMTGSDHDPIVIPDDVGYTPKPTDKYQQSANYADWSLGRLLQYASRQPWYDNTLFVFVADHGCWMGVNHYDVSFAYQHIPLVLFAPGYTSGKAFNGIGLQTDVPATIAGLVLRKPWLNLSLSRDLLRDAPRCAVFSNDDRLACMTDSLLFIYRGRNETPGLYRYKNADEHNYFTEDSATALPMRQQAFAWLQTSQWLIENKKSARR